MTARNKTLIFIVATAVIIAVFDVYIIMDGGKEASISHMMIELSYEYPSLTFLLGFLCGHLFWRMKSTKKFQDAKID